jgi:hypothetical protein
MQISVKTALSYDPGERILYRMESFLWHLLLGKELHARQSLPGGTLKSWSEKLVPPPFPSPERALRPVALGQSAISHCSSVGWELLFRQSIKNGVGWAELKKKKKKKKKSWSTGWSQPRGRSITSHLRWLLVAANRGSIWQPSYQGKRELLRKKITLSIVARTSNPSIKETEAGGLLQVLYQQLVPDQLAAKWDLSQRTKIKEEISNESWEIEEYSAWDQNSVLQSCHSVGPGTQHPWSLECHRPPEGAFSVGTSPTFLDGCDLFCVRGLGCWMCGSNDCCSVTWEFGIGKFWVQG